MLVLVKAMLLESISLMDMLENIRQIAGLCAHSKRKRSRHFTGCSSLSKRIWKQIPRTPQFLRPGGAGY
jgi:hypothetical protein